MLPAEVDLPELPSETCRRRLRVMIAMPVLALKKMKTASQAMFCDESSPAPMLAHVRDAVDETLRVKRHHQAHRSRARKMRGCRIGADKKTGGSPHADGSFALAGEGSGAPL